MSEVEKLLNNITFEPYVVADGKFGDKINGSWSGIIQDLISGKASVSFAPFTETSERAEVVQFSLPYLNVGLRLMELKKKVKPVLESFLLPFSWNVWISVIGVILLVGLLLWIFDTASPYGLSKIDNPELNLPNAFLNSGIGMTGQLGNPGRSWATRILTLGYYLFLIIVTASYTANLTNVLTTPSSTTQITSFSDIKAGKIIGTVQNSASEIYLTKSIFQNFKGNIKYYKTFEVLIKALRMKEIDYLIFDSPIIGYYSKSYPCDTQELKENFDFGNYAVAMTNNSIYQNQISQALMKLKENGKIDELISRWLSPTDCVSTTSTASIGFETFGGVFMCFGFLVIFCTCIIIIEIIFNFIYKLFGDKFPWLREIHIFFGGYTQIPEEPKSIKFNNPEQHVGSNINLSLSCVSLDTISGNVPNPMIIVFRMQRGFWTQIAKTELHGFTKNPTFKKKVYLHFRLEDEVDLRFVVLDINPLEEMNVENQIEIGSLYCSIADIIGSAGMNYSRPLIHSSDEKKECGILTIDAEGDADDSVQYLFDISATKIQTFLRVADAFIVISRLGLDGDTFYPVYKSEPIFMNNHPKWKKFMLNQKILCENDAERPIKIDVYDYNRSGNHFLIGSLETNLKEILNQVPQEIIDSYQKEKFGNYQNSGILMMSATKHYDFFDYLRSGMEISLMVAIDFSYGKNGTTQNKFHSPLDEEDTDFKDDFEESIKVIGSILDRYDSDHKYPVYGFGVKDCDWFACNGNNQAPEVSGVDEILKVYKKASIAQRPAMKSKFAPTIQRAGIYSGMTSKSYYILLIVTQGSIDDMNETISQILQASVNPLTIVIVGIGNNNFKKMIDLDQKEFVFKNKEKLGMRDIVHFFDFNLYKKSPQKLSQDVLHVIPNQIEEYVYIHKIPPTHYHKHLKRKNNQSYLKLLEMKNTDEITIELTNMDPMLKKVPSKNVDSVEEQNLLDEVEHLTNEEIEISPFSAGNGTTGFSIELMQEISKIANFTFESYTVADGKFGEKINGTWNGVMGELVSKRADVTFAPLTYTAERATDVSFSSPYLNIGLRLMSLKEKQKVNLTSFLSPFEWTVWLSVVGVIVLVGILLWIYDLLSPYGLSKIDNPELNLANAFLNSGIGMTGQLGNPGRSWATRILTLGYYLFLIIVTASYTANLTNVLTESSATSSLSSYRDITKGVYTGTIENSAVSLFLLTNPVYSVIKPFLKLYPTFDDLLVALRSKKIGAAIMDSPIVSFIAGNAPCDIQENGEVFGPANYALAAPENATYISELSTAVLQLKESGTIDLLIVKYLTSQGCTATASGTSIGFDKFGGVFVSFGILVVFCTLIIVVEICFAFIWKSFGDKFPFLFFIHEFFGGGAKFTQKEELKDTFNNTSENTGVNVDLSFNCISLETTSGKIPDPLVLCFIMERGLWKEIGRTEIGENTKNPTFKKKISLDFKFEEQQNLRFVVLNIDSERSIDVEEQEEIGSLFCTLADIIGSPGGNFQKSIESPSKKVKNCGILGIIGSGDEESSTQYLFKISAKNLDHFMGLLDPFLVVSRLGLDNETFVPIYKTETVFFSRKPRWKPFTLNYKILAKNDPKRPIKFDIYDFNSSGHHGYVGTVESSVQNLKYSPHVGDVAAVATLQTLKLTTKGKIFEVVNSDKYSKSKTYINSGLLEIEMTKHYDFFDYLRSGLEISLMVAIDFSGGSSYGINRFIKSIEEVDATVEESTTDFEESIQVVGSVLDKYDSDHRYPVYGFGVEGCDWFACNGDNNNPEVEGIEGVIKAYKSAQTTINPSRSSKFSPLIKKAGAYAKLSDDNYFILLILTHGLISDMTETINEIIDASNHPISIVIVGIGSSKFTEMIKLDGNETKLSNSDAKKVTRDIVQFVSFNKYKRNAQKLAEEVLGEIPHQIEQYLYMNDIQPEKFKKDLEHYENEHKDIESLDIKVIEEQPTEDISINIELPDVKIEEKKVEEEKVDEEKEKETAVKIEEPKVEIEQEKEEKTEEKVEQDEKVKIEEINQEGNE